MYMLIYVHNVYIIVESSANAFQGLKKVFISMLRHHYRNVMDIL